MDKSQRDVLLLSVGGDSVTALVQGDDAFSRIAYVEAARCYQQGLESAPDDCALLWRLARVSVCMAEVEEDPVHSGKYFCSRGKMPHGVVSQSIRPVQKGTHGSPVRWGIVRSMPACRNRCSISQELVAETACGHSS